MISIDDHPPPDPSSSDHQNHHQQKVVSHDLKINNGEKAPAGVSDIDLLKPTDAILDDTNNNPLPNFSIRDYVFGSRCKDISCNWPFSHENLQLCLQYGVKNLLPPFQSLDLINNPSRSRCGVENRLPDEEIVTSSDGKLMGSIEFESHLEKDLKKSHPASSEKTLNTTNRTTVKKHKLFMKLNSGVEPVEEVTPNNFIVSETMLASKVCPVCKTFSSSSNTTLNAHIDRCLSEESSMKWTTNSKIIVKHRIKPRKTRFMVDIYKTAPCCTVEELDRRNGTSWATNSNFPDQELEFQAEEKKEEVTFAPEVNDHEGSVYIDTNGTKVRILSMPKVGTLDDHEARKLQKGGKGSKIITEKKKKAYKQKNRHKIFKLSANSKKFCSLKPHHPVSEAIGGQEEDVAIEERRDKDVSENPMKARVHKQMDDLAITRPPWACSKRTDLTKKRKSAMLTKPKEGSPLQDSYEDPLGIRSKGGKFSSLKDNPSSASQERDAGSKLNLKRKFSALKKSRVDCLPTEINAVTGPSQDSSKQKSQTDEDTIKKLSFEIVNVLEINTKKSITSKSSNGYSSEDLEISFVDPQLDVESARTDQAPSHSDVQGSFMSLRNSFDDEFSKMVSRLDNKFDIKNIMIGHNPEDCTNDTEKQDNYFQEVDPIPIPGPPGSFLPPSPGGDMVSEELQANSSLTTTSRFHSSEDQYHHDTFDKDSMLDSPISTVSSSSLARSSAIRSDDKLSVGFASLQETSLRYTGVHDVDQKSSSVKASNSRSIDAIFAEKCPTTSGFQNEQPCVCSRKNGPSYHQESAFESNRKPELFSLINHPKLPPSLPPPPPPPEPVKSRGDASVKLPFYRDCESAVSPSTPVLRLMGKNLTVVKMDDDDHVPSSQQFIRPPHQQQLHNIQNNDYTCFFYGYPSDDQHRVIFNHNQIGSNPRHFNVYPPKNSRNLADLRPIMAPTDCHRLDIDHNEHDYPWKAAKEVIVIDDSSENEADDRMLQERMRRNELHDGRWGSSSMLQSNSVGLIPLCPPYPR